MPLSKVVFAARAAIIQLPGYLFYWLCWWIYPQMTLREKAALCPHPEVRKLLLIRSGIRVGRQVEINFGILCHGRGRNPPPVDLGDRVALGPHVTLVTSSYPGCSKLLQLADVEPLVAWLRPIRVEEERVAGGRCNCVARRYDRAGRGGGGRRRGDAGRCALHRGGGRASPLDPHAISTPGSLR